TTGPLLIPAHATRAAFSAPGSCPAHTKSSPLYSIIALAACPHGLGVPRTSTRRRPGRATMSSIAMNSMRLPDLHCVDADGRPPSIMLWHSRRGERPQQDSRVLPASLPIAGLYATLRAGVQSY